MAIRPGVELASLSDIGCQRENNEDSYSYWEGASQDQYERKGRLAIVADGMGGYEGGQEASRLAVKTIEEQYVNAPNGPQSALLDGFQIAHERIQKHASEHPDLHGMGTTATAIALIGNQLYFSHVGDSRLYLVRGSSISRLTHDHSYVSRLVEHGVISSEEAEFHPQRHILTSALGAGAEITPDYSTSPVTLQKGDVLVLCTDGLWGLLGEDEVQRISTGNAPSDACRELVRLAKERGGPDNITVQILRIQ
jgi:PPM family protein phosphatase